MATSHSESSLRKDDPSGRVSGPCLPNGSRSAASAHPSAARKGDCQLQRRSCAARDFLSPRALPRDDEFRKRDHLRRSPGRSPAPRPASHDLGMSPPSSAAPVRRDDFLQHLQPRPAPQLATTLVLAATGRGSAHAGCSPWNHLGSLAARRWQLSRIHACQHYDHRRARCLAWIALETASAVAATPVLRHDREPGRCWLARGPSSDVEWSTSGRRTTTSPEPFQARPPDVLRQTHISPRPSPDGAGPRRTDVVSPHPFRAEGAHTAASILSRHRDGHSSTAASRCFQPRQSFGSDASAQRRTRARAPVGLGTRQGR
jgi:hypothetical protein